jgi:copper chaperone NosL
MIRRFGGKRMPTLPKKYFAWMLTLLIITVISASGIVARAADLLELPDGSKLDLSQKCPVCGMTIGGKEGQGVTVSFKDGRVATFGGVAAAVFRDGHVVGFEGARCLFIYNSVPQKYGVGIKDITRQFVTDLTSKKLIDLTKAFLVLGSNVKGPMGYDLIPFATKEEANKFAAENDGKWIVQLHEVHQTGQESLQVPAPGAPETAAPVHPPAKQGGPSAVTGGQPIPQENPLNQQPKRLAPSYPQPSRYPDSRGYGGHHEGMHH